MVIEMDWRYFEDSDYFDSDSGPKLTAKRTEDGTIVYAISTKKEDGPFFCPLTYDPVIVRKCINKIDHFAYIGRKSSISTEPESPIHKACKAEILDGLSKAFPEGAWQAERELGKNDSINIDKQRPDLSGYLGKRVVGTTAVAIEIQKSTLSIRDIIRRTEMYSKRRMYVIWIVPLNKPLGKEKFRPRLFERFLHTLFYGKVYYWTEGSGLSITPVHFETAYRHIEERDWYDELGEWKTAGGYDAPYKTMFNPIYGNTVCLDTDFFPEQRDSFEQKNEKMNVPKCLLWMDKQRKWW